MLLLLLESDPASRGTDSKGVRSTAEHKSGSLTVDLAAALLLEDLGLASCLS